MSLIFKDTGIPRLDFFLYKLQKASEYVHNSTRWDELESEDGVTFKDEIDEALADLVIELQKHVKLINKLKRQGFIE